MKYINLLPSELQLKSAVTQRRTRPFSKVMLGCVVVPGLIILASFFTIIVIRYRYKQEITGTKSQPGPETTAKNEVVAVTSRLIKRRQTIPKKQPQPPAEKAAGSAIVSPKPQTDQSHTVRKTADGFTLHIGSFTSKNEAEALMQGLMEQKLEPYRQPKQITKTVYTIYVGQFSTMKEAMELTRQLEKHGYEAFINIRHQGANWVGVKGCSSRVKVQKLAERLLALGYPAKIVPEQVQLTIYQVNLGHYKEYRQTKNTQNRLEKLGYRSTSIIRE